MFHWQARLKYAEKVATRRAAGGLAHGEQEEKGKRKEGVKVPHSVLELLAQCLLCDT